MPKVPPLKKGKQSDCMADWLSRAGGRAPKNPQRDTWGWVSEIPEDNTLNQSFVEEQYGLQWYQLRGVASKETNYDGRKGRAYYETAVEWKAWEVHGGPVGLWHFVKKKLQEHIEGGHNPTHFHPPYDYQRDHIYDVFVDKPPQLPDRYCHGSPILQECKSELPLWAWNRCNKALNTALLQTIFTLVLPGARELAMLSAVTFVCAFPAYATRPPGDPLVVPSCLHTVAATLGCAVSPPPDPPDWDVVEKPKSFTLDVRADRFDWSANYLEAIFAAILDAVEGQEDARESVWNVARWMVYDKYVTIFGRGLRYDRESETWRDDAREWLEGRMAEDMLRGSLRGTCASGRKYNKLLPDPPTGASLSSAPPAPIPGSSSSAASSATAVAGPSSAPR